tara:strand:+ start:19654 stop:19791 length:138 start_codon:yes stop_codon:yes gene_type:complete
MSDNDIPRTELRSWQEVLDAIESRFRKLEDKVDELIEIIDELEGK